MKPWSKKFVGTAVLTATLLAGTVPAEARHRHRHHDRIDGGDILAGIVLLGAIAAIAGSGKSERDRERRSDDDPRAPLPRSEDYRAVPDGGSTAWVPGSDSVEARAVDACSWAAEGELGSDARVGQIDAVDREGEILRVTGTVAAPEMMPRNFSCSFRGGRVIGVTFNP